jgi:hypothetical protein
MDCIEKYGETYLPPKELFYISLKKEHITEDDYKNAQEVWDTFIIQNLREFTVLYNKIDVFLLDNIIENFHHLSLETYKLGKKNSMINIQISPSLQKINLMVSHYPNSL